MENRRTEIARDELIESLAEEEPTPRFEGRAGGNLQADIATQVELDRVRDPERREGVKKANKVEHAEESLTRHPADS